MSENWDRIRIRLPVCYLPPIWELIVNKEIDFAQAVKLAGADPSPDPWVVANHLKQRVALVKKLSESGKLDAGVAKVAIAHFNAHLKEIKALQAQH